MGIIIGLSGHARAGKDTFGEYLIECLKERHRRDFIHVAFAAQLKAMCKEHFELSDDQLWGDKKEIIDKRFRKALVPKFADDDMGMGATEFKCGTIREPLYDYWTSREIMQELGGFYRKIDSAFWIKALNIYLISNDIKDAIITDVRHINECEYVKINKGVIIKIFREDVAKIHGMQHESETALDDRPGGYFDIEINNCGTLENLYDAAEDTSDAIIMLENMMKKGRIVEDGKR